MFRVYSDDCFAIETISTIEASFRRPYSGQNCCVPRRVLVGVARLGRSMDQRPVALCGELPWISCCFQARWVDWREKLGFGLGGLVELFGG